MKQTFKQEIQFASICYECFDAYNRMSSTTNLIVIAVLLLPVRID